jgi:hypothetical protein
VSALFSFATNAAKLVHIESQFIAVKTNDIDAALAGFQRAFVIRVVRLEYDSRPPAQVSMSGDDQPARSSGRDDKFQRSLIGIDRDAVMYFDFFRDCAAKFFDPLEEAVGIQSFGDRLIERRGKG